MIITFGKPDLPTLLAMKLDCNLSRVKPYNSLDIDRSGLIITPYFPIDTS
jgi:hypothetical protein